MKRIGGLFDAICDRRTLALAAWRAAQGKRERPEVRQFLDRFDAEADQIGHALRDGKFCFGSYRTFAIRDPKCRTIHAPPFRDRVVHHAIVAVTGPVFERGAIAQSYACRKGRGQHAALARARQWMRRGDWFLKLDVAKFYDSVDHEILRLQLARRFRERRLLDLFDHLLVSHFHSLGKGLPIGALTSQYLGNFYLDPVDHWVNQTCHVSRYLRYMDDMLLLADRDTLAAVHGRIGAMLDGLGLAIKQGGVMNRCETGVPYLGFVLYPDRVRLNRAGRKRLRRRLKDLERASEAGRIGEAELQARAEALFAHARFGDDLAWRRMVTGFSRFRETQGPDPRFAGRLVEQYCDQLPLLQP